MSSAPLVEQYLDFYQKINRAAMIVNSLLGVGIQTQNQANATSWVHAAIETNVSKFIVSKRPQKSQILSSDKCSSPKQVPSSLRHPSATKKMNPKRENCHKGSGLKETANLADKLLLHSREWFFKYMENSFNNGFRFCIGEVSEIASLLRQLKKVNQWLDDLRGGGIKVNERIEELKTKLYGFLLEHVDVAVASIEWI
ncbi:hypothetical protein RCOM_1776060 [Ricinus communis]|uniref:DUF6857 domain-containing protein n=1 Tax=Ricinus communis TaxID=3988 RepID=B9REM8_RICCO|nr:hypothetical protein RCOM_1776060 [Ricinus communis]